MERQSCKGNLDGREWKVLDLRCLGVDMVDDKSYEKGEGEVFRFGELDGYEQPERMNVDALFWDDLIKFDKWGWWEKSIYTAESYSSLGRIKVEYSRSEDVVDNLRWLFESLLRTSGFLLQDWCD